MDFFLGLNIIFIVFSALSSTLVYAKYRQKKTAMIKSLLMLFIFYTFYLTANTIQLWLNQNNVALIAPYASDGVTFPLIPEIFNIPALAYYITFYTLDLVLAVSTSIIAFKFKNVTFVGEEKTKLSKFVQFLGYGTIILAACVILSINVTFTAVAGFFVTLHLFFVYIPYTINAYQSFQRAKQMKLEGHFRVGFFSIMLMALCFVLRNVFLYIDVGAAVLRGAMLGDPTVHTEFNIVAWVFLILAYVTAYFGYIWPGRKKK